MEESTNSMDDLYGILDSTEPVEKKEESTPAPTPSEPVEEKKSNGKINLWEDEITPKTVNKDSLLRFNRMFSVMSHGEVPGEVIILIEQISKLLISKGFTFRYDGNKQDKLATQAYNASKQRCEIYLPWKGFNKDVTAKLNRPTELAYHYASGLHNAFNKIPPTVRAIVARNTHVILGDECNTPINLFITWTPDGAEVNKDVDYKVTGNASFFISACDALDIPVFNLKNATAKDRIVEFINTLK